MSTNTIEIMTVLNGWKVRCGCQEVVFTDAEKLCDELKAYLKDPPKATERYLKESVNAKWLEGPLPAPQYAGLGGLVGARAQQERPF